MIDLITNIDMQAFHSHGGLQSFINRLDVSIETNMWMCFSNYTFGAHNNT